MKHLNREYIHLSNNKTPLHKLDEVFSYQEANQWVDGAGVLIPEPYIVLDFDHEWDFKKMLIILEAHNLHPPIMKSTRGGHIWFKTSTQYKSDSKQQLPILLNCDVKCWGVKDKRFKKVYTVVKQNGLWRKWLNEVEEKDVPELPYWLTPRKLYSKRSLATDFEEGVNRNTNFSKVVWSFIKGTDFSQEQIQNIIQIINDYLLESPLPEKEIETLTREAVENIDFKATVDKRGFKDLNGNLIHANVGDYLIDTYKLKRYKQELWAWDFKKQRYFKADWFIRKVLHDLIFNISNHKEREVMHYIEIELPDLYQGTPPKYVGLNNGLFNTETFEIEFLTPNIFTPYNLDIAYPHNLLDLDLDKVEWIHERLMEILGTDEQYNVLMQLIGYCLIPHNLAQQVIFFYGTGGNGKSFISEKLIKRLFDPYVSALPLHLISERFKMATIAESLITVANENATKFVKNADIFKSLVTGESQELEKKGKDSQYGAVTTKLVYSFNELPRFEDVSTGLQRRILFLNFKNRFDHHRRDPLLEKKVNQHWKDISSFLIYEAIEGVKELEKNNWNFPQINQDLLEEMKQDSDPIREWINYQSYTLDYFTKEITDGNGKQTYHPVGYYRKQFNNWAKDNDLRATYKPITFTKRLREIFPKLLTKKFWYYDLQTHERLSDRRYINSDEEEGDE